MKWSMDTHKYISEVTRKALQVLNARGITSESSPEEIDSAERELGACGVYKNYEGAKGRIRRALFTYFKAYGCMNDNETLTELGTAFAENKLSVQELSFIYILAYKFEDDSSSYYPTNIILECLSKMRTLANGKAFITPYDFKALTELSSVSEVSDAFVQNLLEKHNQQTEEVNERAIGFDVWAKMLVQAGLLQRNAEKNLEAANWEFVDWILSAYAAGVSPEKGKIASGVITYIPQVPLTQSSGNAEDYLSESAALQAYLFDGLSDRAITKYVLSENVQINGLKSAYGLNESSRHYYKDFIGLERVVGHALLQSTNLAVKNVGQLLLDLPLSEADITSVSTYPMYSIEWFREKAEDYPTLDQEAAELLEAFYEKYSVERISELSGTDLLNTIFLNAQNPDNLCRVLEFGPKIKDVFGSIKGGTAYKYGLFFSSQGCWMTGSHQKPQTLSEEEAVLVGTQIRDRLVAGAKAIEEFGEVTTIEDYKNLYISLRDVTQGDIDKVWFLKYYQMLYPSVFATNYADYAQRTVLNALGKSREKYALVRMGQIKLFADECQISNVMFNRIFWDNYVEDEGVKDDVETDEEVAIPPIKHVTGYVSNMPRNRILFGAPGTGKSFTLNGDRKELLYGNRMVDETSIDRSLYGEYERVTFHPDYSYANFVGTYKPVPFKDGDDKDAITYSYVPGPFMRTYVKALKNSRTNTPKPYLLVIEEINRANVAAVFGDVFQLLDRDENNISEYPIQASEDIKKYLASELGGSLNDYAEIRIPDNMFIWATMNSADQGVFPMDTAFKRRWDFTYLGIDDSEKGIVGKKVILGKGEHRRVVEWNELRKAINEELLTYKVNEDKLMGPYFISKKILPEGDIIETSVFTRVFKNKVIMYLFDDAAKQKRPSLFAGCSEKDRSQYSKICAAFDSLGVFIFCDAISSKFIDMVPEDDA